jgi:hypothetical protein
MDTDLISELTELNFEYVNNIRTVHTAIQMIRNGINLNIVSDETGLEENILKDMKTDIDAEDIR